MKKLLFLFSLLLSLQAYSQEYKDTIFSVREFTCSCKYNLNIADDNGIFDRSEKPAHTIQAVKTNGKNLLRRIWIKDLKGRMKWTYDFR